MPKMQDIRSVYFAFFALELSGMLVILWVGIPIFRSLLIVRQIGSATDEMIMFSASAVILASYWRCLRFGPPFDLPCVPLLAHIVLFCSRLSFVFASSIFSVVAYRYSNLLELTVTKTLIFVTALFAIFCFSRHLESLGNFMLTGHKYREQGTR